MEYFIVDKVALDGKFSLPAGQRVVSVISQKFSRTANYYVFKLLVEKDPMHLPAVELR